MSWEVRQGDCTPLKVASARLERTAVTNHCPDKRFVCLTCGAGYPVAGTCRGRAADKHSPIETVAR